MTRRKSILILAAFTLLFSVGYLAAQTLTSGWTFVTATSAGGCLTPGTTAGLCAVTASSPSLQLSVNGGAYVQIWPVSTNTAIPATFTCTVTATNVTADGKGGSGWTETTSSCK